MLRRHIITGLFTILVLDMPLAFASSKTNDRGFWLTEDARYVIAVRLCHDTLCGKIYWTDSDVAPFDVKNPDPARRQNPLCGMNVLLGFKHLDTQNWINGTVYRPKTGKTYHATIQILPSGNAVLHGYILLPIFGQSEVLTPVSPKDYPACKVPSSVKDSWSNGPRKSARHAQN